MDKDGGGEASNAFMIHYMNKNRRVLEDDEKAQIKSIFKHYDFTNRDRANTSDLPNILRLLQHNVGEAEYKELIYMID